MRSLMVPCVKEISNFKLKSQEVLRQIQILKQQLEEDVEKATVRKRERKPEK